MDPIQVHSSPMPDQMWAGIRQLLLAAIAFVAGRGLIAGDTAGLLTTLVGTMGMIVLFVIGQLKTRLRAQQLATLAADPAVPQVQLKSPT